MKLKQAIRIIMVSATLVCIATACVDQNYVMLMDDEVSGADMDNERALTNGELEMDDWDR